MVKTKVLKVPYHPVSGALQMIKNPNGTPTTPPFEANWNSQCKAGDTIDEGETIVRADGAHWHVECAEEAGYRTGRS